VAEHFVVHETCYKWPYPGCWVHRARLKALRAVIRRFGLTAPGSWADFGCSNGYVIEQLVKSATVAPGRIMGYDHSNQLVALARGKKIPRAEFITQDLLSMWSPDRQFELVTCFETLEHIGDFRTAFRNLFHHLQPRGLLVISVPNETGFWGVLKFIVRVIGRKPSDRSFFTRVDGLAYFRALLAGRSIADFRATGQATIDSHLGFDYRMLFRHIEEEYVRRRLLQQKEARQVFAGAGHIRAYTRIA